MGAGIKSLRASASPREKSGTGLPRCGSVTTVRRPTSQRGRSCSPLIPSSVLDIFSSMAPKRLLPVALLFWMVFGASALAQRVVYFPQLGDGRAGNIRFQTTLIFVNAGPTTNVTVEFFSTGPGAAPLMLSLGNLGTRSRFDVLLNAGASISLQTPGTGTIQVGYARITIPAGANVGGTAVFTRTDIPTGTILYEAGVPTVQSLRDFTIFVDTLGNRDTGLAIVNTAAGGASNMVNFRLYDRNFMQIATTNVPLLPSEHQARFVSQIFSAVQQVQEMQGSITASSSNDVAAVTLRQNDAPGEFPNDVPTLTAFPVVQGRTAAAGGAFSLLSDGRLAVVLDLSPEEREVTGAVFHLYEGDHQVAEWVRGIDSEGVASFVLPAAERSGRPVTVDRVETELIFTGGEKSLPFALNP